MRLYLSSFRFGNRPEELIKLAGIGLRTAVIMNARDYQESEHRALRRNEEMVKLRELGFESEEIDLREYFAKSAELGDKLKDFGMVWVSGGNVFLLRYAMQASGCDELLNQRINDGSLVYGGYSAGACVLSATIAPLTVIDDPAVVQQVYGVSAIETGLGILKYVFVPHYMSDHPESNAAEKAVDDMEKSQQSHMALTDGEVLIINGDGSEETVVS